MAPDIAGQGIADPVALLHAAALMLEHIDRDDLPRCRRIVELHGGTLDAEFPAAGGTRIIMGLP